MRKSTIAWVTGASALLLAAGLVVPVSSVSAASVGRQGRLSAAEAKALSNDATKRVIVVFKNQESQLPATRALVKSRTAAVDGLQRPILGELKATKAHNVHSYTIINAVSATVSAGEEARLAANPAVAEVVPDQIIHLASPLDAPTSSERHRSGSGRTPPAGTCPAKGAPPLLEPQALQAIHADAVPERRDGPVPRDRRLRGDGGLHRRRSRHQ